MLENVIVNVHDFLYPADFYVIKMNDNGSAESSGVLLGRPFLRTAKIIIDVFDGTICSDYNGEKYTFSIDEGMKRPLDVENLYAINVINPLVQEYLETELIMGKRPFLRTAKTIIDVFDGTICLDYNGENIHFA